MRVLSFLLVLAGCASPIDLDGSSDTIDGRADSTSAALEGTREGHGVLRLLNDGGDAEESATDFVFLDDDVALDRRAARNLIEHRDGPDGVFGTSDDDLFSSIEEVDDVPWVGASALGKLAEFALLNDYVPSDDDLLGTYDRVDFSYADAERVLDYANTASAEALSEASVPSRAVTSITAARPIASVEVLAGLYWVGTRTLEHLLAAVTVAQPVGGELCETNDDCSAGLRCTGRASDAAYSDDGPPPGSIHYGKCRDTSNRDGFQDDCDVDADCNERLICIAQSVYTQGYCADDWKRESFTNGETSSISSIAMSQPTSQHIVVLGQASVPEDVIIDIDIEHSDPSSLWIGLQPPTGQEAVTLWDGATMAGPLPSQFIDRSVERDNSVNGRWTLLVQNVDGRGEGVLRGWTLTVTSRWD